MPGVGPTFRINGSFGSPEKNFSINFSKGNTKFCLNLHYNADDSYYFDNGKEISEFEGPNKNVNFPLNFVLEAYLLDLDGNVYGFSVDYNSIDRSDILNIDKYLMTINNIK